MMRPAAFFLLLWLALHSIAAALPAVAAGGGPQQQCGWPALLHGGLFQPGTVRVAQLLLTHALHENVTATGSWDSATIAAVVTFREAHALGGIPVLDHVVWPALVALAAPLTVGAVGPAVEAAQIALNANGFRTPVTREFDEETSSAVMRFNQARVGIDGGTITNNTWHLLVTQCNDGGVFWFDAGWPQGNMTLDMLSCLRNEYRFEYAVFECWRDDSELGSFYQPCVGNIARALDAGFDHVGAYMFPQRAFDAATQARWLVANLTAFGVRTTSIMLDIEGGAWNNFPQASNVDFIVALRSVFQAAGFNVTVYCGREWAGYFGANFTGFSDLPVIYAHYDNIASFVDYGAYGGWAVPAGKQFWDGSGGESVCGTGPLDWDWSPAPFWTTATTSS